MHKNKESNNLVNWTVILTLSTAHIYLCTWTFEFITCTFLGIPPNLIEPTTGTVLFCCGLVFFFIVLIVIVGGMLLFFLTEFTLLNLTVLANTMILLANILQVYNSHELSGEFFARSTLIIGGFWAGLAIMSWLARWFCLRKNRRKIIYFFFTEDTDFKSFFGETFASLPGLMKKMIGYGILLFVCSITVAFFYGKYVKPDYRLTGKEPLVLLKKYNDILICGYLDTKTDKLTDSLKIIKLSGGESYTLKLFAK